MTVKELIEKLEKCENKNIQVFLYEAEFGEIFKIDAAKEFKNNNTGTTRFDIEFYKEE